jgi:glycosyltransferase involved in cell wall biosynthesis
MKILIGTSTPFHLAHLARELTRLGHDVKIIGYMPKIGVKRFLDRNVKYQSFFIFTLPFSFFALQSFSKRLKKWAIYLMMPIIDWFISRQISDQDAFIGLSGVCLKSLRKAKKKGILTFSDRGASHVLTQMEVINNAKKMIYPNSYIKRELQGYENSDFIAIPSIFTYNSFINNEIEPNKLFLNNYGVDFKNFFSEKDNKKNSNKINLLFVGNWSYQKGCDLLSDLLCRLDNVIITHIGNKGDLDFPESKRFISKGVIPNCELFKFYSKNDVLVLPSRQDGFGMVLLEALACGTPIIASENTGALDILNIVSNKNIVQVFKNEDLKTLVKLVSRINESDFVVNDSRDFFKIKEHFSWNSYAIRYANFINNKLMLNDK